MGVGWDISLCLYVVGALDMKTVVIFIELIGWMISGLLWQKPHLE